MLLPGCNPAKKALKEQQALRELQNDFILHNPPAIDTNTKYLPGKVDTVQVIVILTVKDSTAVQKVKDSLKAAFTHTNAALTADCERQVNEAFETGKAAALYQLSKQKVAKPRPDTIEKTVYPTLYIEGLKNKAATLQGQLIECQAKQSWLWYFIFSVIANVIFIILIIQLSTAKRK